MPNTKILVKNSSTPGNAPSTLDFGELGLNYADGKLFYKNSNSVIVSFTSGGNNFGTINANGTFVVADAVNDILTVLPGNFIYVTGDAVNDAITISANLAPAWTTANTALVTAIAAFAQANTGGGGGGGGSSVYVTNVSPSGATANSLWWNTDTGRLSVYYNDGNSIQWVDTAAFGGIFQGANSTTKYVEVEIDFGSQAVKEKKFIISDPEATANSIVVATHALDAATGKSEDENEMDSLLLTARANTGNVVVYARAIPGPVSGKFKISYSIK